MPGLLLRENVHRDGLLPTLGARTWRSRAVAAAALADFEAVASRAAYSAWLRRTAAAWSRLPVVPAASGHWPLVAVGPDCLGGRRELLADLRDLAVAGDGSAGDGARVPAPATSGCTTDEAFLVGAAYVAVVAAADAAVLTDAAVALVARTARAPGGTRFLRRCRSLAPARPALRRELVAWSLAAGPDATERAVLTARTLSLDLAEALGGRQPGR